MSTFTIEPDSGELAFANLQSAHGLWPSYAAVDSQGQCLVVVNYGTGTVVRFPIRDDGSLDEASDIVHHQGSSVNPDRQEGPHPHCVLFDPTEKVVLVADLGLDRIVIYWLGGLKPHAGGSVATRPGSGPRHLAYHPGGHYLYCTNELDSTLTAFAGDVTQGTLHEFQIASTLPDGYDGRNSPAHLQFTPSGNTLYVSNRGHDSIAVFAADPASGYLRLQSHISTRGNNPRHFAVDPTGQYLVAANETSSSLATFRIAASTGDLSLVDMTEVPNPVFVLCRLR